MGMLQFILVGFRSRSQHGDSKATVRRRPSSSCILPLLSGERHGYRHRHAMPRAILGFWFGVFLVPSSLYIGLHRVTDMYSGTSSPALELPMIKEGRRDF